MTLHVPRACSHGYLAAGRGGRWAGHRWGRGCRFPGGDGLARAKDLLGVSDSVRLSWKHAVTSGTSPPSAASTKQPALGVNGSQKGPSSPQDTLGRPLTYLLPKLYSKSS